MNTTLLSADKDPMGAAIADYYKRHKAERLRVFSSQFDEDEIPVKELFRTEKQMPLLNVPPCNWLRERFWMWEPEAVVIVLPCRKQARMYMPLIFHHFQ